MDIVEACGRDAWHELRDDWEGLLARCERATIYQTWEWNEAWWHAYGRGMRLRILRVKDGSSLVGLVPLYVSRHLGTPLRRLAFVGTGASDYMDVIAPAAMASDVSRAVAEYLVDARGFDLADLQQLAPGALMLSGFEDCHPPAGGRAASTLVAQEPCPFVALPASWGDYTRRLGKKMRSNVAYYDRLLARTFPGATSSLAGSGDLKVGMDALFDLHQRRWRARLLPGVLGGKRTQAFHRAVAARFLERGWLRLHLLRVEGRVAASLYCFQFRSRYYYYLGGFAPELSRYSLGTVLTAHAMRQAIDEGCEEFDFLRGNEPYKYRWEPEERVNCRWLLAGCDSLRAHAMLRLNRLERYVEHRAKVFAEQRGRRRST